MTDKADRNQRAQKIEPLDPLHQPPEDRFCDVVMDGGVVSGVVYPGFLIELARRFNFHSIGGTSVGAVAAAIAAACEYSRRFGQIAGYNSGLARMPQDLAEWTDEKKTITKIRSLFQPDESVQPLFNCFVEGVEQHVKSKKRAKEVEQYVKSKKQVEESSLISALMHIGKFIIQALYMWVWYAPAKTSHVLGIITGSAATLFACWNFVNASWAWIPILFCSLFCLLCCVVLAPVTMIQQIQALIRLPGFGACSGLKQEGNHLPGFTEWLHEGIQKSAQLQLSKPLTFAQLWAAPAAPDASRVSKEKRSIDLRMMTTCLSHGRVYELPFGADESPVLFRLSEFKRYFPADVISHLRRVSKVATFENLPMLHRRMRERRLELLRDPGDDYRKNRTALRKQSQYLFRKFRAPAKEDPDSGPDLRLLPQADLPIVVAARLSMSCPVLFQAIPLWGFNFDKIADKIDLVCLWFSDGGIGSNFPIHLFDRAIPRWPSFGMKIMEESSRASSNNKPQNVHVPFSHRGGAEDNLLFPNDTSFFSTGHCSSKPSDLLRFLFSIYATAKDGHDQSFLRMPDVRNRVVRIFLNGRLGNMLNLKISPKEINELAANEGVNAGRIVGDAYLAEATNPKYADWVDLWRDHRWVRMNMLVRGLREYLRGLGYAMQSNTFPRSTDNITLLEQIRQSTKIGPLGGAAGRECKLSSAQAEELLTGLQQIANLEQHLTCAKFYGIRQRLQETSSISIS